MQFPNFDIFKDNNKKLKQLKNSEVKQFRTEVLEKQNGNCAICGCTITESTGISLDHQHKRLKAPIGVDGAGLIRGVLCLF